MKNFSKLVLGTVQFGLRYGVANTSGQVTFDAVKEILRAALDGGVDSLDTAAGYGESEDVLGRAIAELGVASRFKIVSKVPRIPAEGDPEKFIRASVENSLRRLRLETLPLVLFHDEEDMPHLPILRELVGKGLIEAAGVSLDSTDLVTEAETIDAVQFPCNPLDHRYDALIARRAEAGLQTFFRSVYLQGLLVMPEEKIPATLAEVIPWRKKLESFGLPLKELCFRYLLSIPGKNSVLFGVDTPDQLRENLSLARAGALPPDLYQAVKDAVPLLPDVLIRPSKWRR